MLISEQLKANKTAYAEYLLQLVIQYFIDDDNEESAEYWKNMWIHDGAEKTITAFYVYDRANSDLDDIDTVSWCYGVGDYTGDDPLNFESWMMEEGRIPTPPLPQEPLHFRILYDFNNEGWNWTCEEEAEHAGGNFITNIMGAHTTGAPIEFVAYASTDAEADYVPVTIDWNSQYADSNVLVLTGVPQTLDGVSYNSTFSLIDSGHGAQLQEHTPVTLS